MKQKFFIITLVMMLFAVQGYAQREGNRGRGQGQHRTEQRTSHARPGGQTRQSREVQGNHRKQSTPRREVSNQRDGQRSSHARPGGQTRQSREVQGHHRQQTTPQREVSNQRGKQNRSHDRGHYTPPRHNPPTHSRPTPPPPRPKPVYRHHHSYHHHHHCTFNDWYWYSWGGYRNRFICHRHYHNRFFDSLLGYYLWGTLTAPTRLDIGNMTFTRHGDMLKIQNGNSCSYLELYRIQSVTYNVGYTTVHISTGSGYASIHFYDEYGNEAVYSL